MLVLRSGTTARKQRCLEQGLRHMVLLAGLHSFLLEATTVTATVAPRCSTKLSTKVSWLLSLTTTCSAFVISHRPAYTSGFSPADSKVVPLWVVDGFQTRALCIVDCPTRPGRLGPRPSTCYASIVRMSAKFLKPTSNPISYGVYKDALRTQA